MSKRESLNKPKRVGRPKKIVDYNAPAILELLDLFGFESWEDSIGKKIYYADLEKNNVIQQLHDLNLLEKFKEVLKILFL